MNTINKILNPTWQADLSQEDIEEILNWASLTDNINECLSKVGINEKISINDFIKESFWNNPIIFEQLKDFLKAKWIEESDIKDNQQCYQKWMEYIQNFENQKLFLSRKFDAISEIKYENVAKSAEYIVNWNISREYFLKKQMDDYIAKCKSEKKVVMADDVLNNASAKCFEAIDREILESLDVTEQSQTDIEKMKNNFFYESIFSLSNENPWSNLKKSVDLENIDTEHPNGIFLYNNTDLFYTAPDQGSTRIFNLNKNWDESLYTINDFDFLLMMSINRDKNLINFEDLVDKYSQFGELENNNWVWFFKRNDDIFTKMDNIEKTKNESKKDKKDKIFLEKYIDIAREIAITNLPL